MEPETQDAPEVLETPAETVETPAETLTPEEIADLKAKAAKADELESKNKQLYERVKKAETPVVPSSDNDLTPADALVLAKADVHEDDLERIMKFAKSEGLTVAKALKDPDLQAILERRSEERRTALATQTGAARGASKVSGEDILAKARKTGEVPDTEEGMQALFAARQAERFPKR